MLRTSSVNDQTENGVKGQMFLARNWGQRSLVGVYVIASDIWPLTHLLSDHWYASDSAEIIAAWTYRRFTMGGDQCQNLQLFLFSTKIICIVKFYIQMMRSLLFAWWSSTYKWYSHLHGEVLHTNDTLICMGKFYIQMILSSAWWSSTYKWYSHLHGEVLHTNDTLICMVKFYI